MEMETIVIDESVLKLYIHLSVSFEKYIYDAIRKKEHIPDSFVINLENNIDNVTALYHGFDDEDEWKRTFGVILNDFKTQLFRINRYKFKRKRMSASEEAKIEAYVDPVVSGYAELTKGKLKTRNRCYDRS